MTSLVLAVLVGLAIIGLAAGLLPTLAVRLQLGALLAADTTTLAPVTANKIALITAPFTPSENLVVGDLTLASFTGSTPLSGAGGAQGVGIDPATGDQVITILAPAGGWLWTCTGAPGSPVTIYGYALLDHTLATLIGTSVITPTVTISKVGDFLDLGKVDMTFVVNPIS